MSQWIYAALFLFVFIIYFVVALFLLDLSLQYTTHFKESKVLGVSTKRQLDNALAAHASLFASHPPLRSSFYQRLLAFYL